MNEKSSKSDQLLDYRKWLVAAEQKSQEDFDKTVLSLSGGALGISFVFLRDVVGPNPILCPSFLFAAWLAWAFSTFAVLTSYYLSHLALRRAIEQVDDGTIYQQRPGGAFARWTALLNAVGAILFLAGVCFITAFANFNLSTKGARNDRQETPVSATTTPVVPAKPAVAATPSDAGQSTPNNRGLHPSTAASSTSEK
ncbi:MAG TPA: hypothetical protein VKS43_08460 [Burkholderiales bacterium]|nr:hypothetical protein [Burkholderiales bacterium]